MKNNILKVFAVLLAVMMLFALASCGGKDKDKDTSETTDTSSVTEKDNQAPTVTAGAQTDAKDGSAKPGGKDTGKDSGKTEDEKQTGSNTSETSKPNG